MNIEVGSRQLRLLTSERGTAIFSTDMRHRYWLTRKWDETLPALGAIGLNPSTANHEDDDQTIKKEIGFAKLLGCGSLYKGNLGAFVSTQQRGLWESPDPIGRYNDWALGRVAAHARILIVCWGDMDNRLWKILRPSLDLVKTFNNVKCLGLTKSGAPKHTSRLGYAAPLMDWRKQ